MRRPTFTVSAYGAILAAMKVARHGSASRDDHKEGTDERCWGSTPAFSGPPAEFNPGP